MRDLTTRCRLGRCSEGYLQRNPRPTTCGGAKGATHNAAERSQCDDVLVRHERPTKGRRKVRLREKVLDALIFALIVLVVSLFFSVVLSN